MGPFFSINAPAVTSRVSLLPRVSVRPAAMEPFQEILAGGAARVGTSAGIGAGGGGGVATITLVRVTMLVTSTVTTLVTVKILVVCADVEKENAMTIPAATNRMANSFLIFDFKNKMAAQGTRLVRP